jgi:hypothetical protein
VVEAQGPVGHEEALQCLRRANGLLFQQAPWGNRRRLPEYLATRKPILAFPDLPETMSQQVLQQYGAATIAKDQGDLEALLGHWYRQFIDGQFVVPAIDEAVVDRFRASAQARHLDQVLRGILAGARGEGRASDG